MVARSRFFIGFYSRDRKRKSIYKLLGKWYVSGIAFVTTHRKMFFVCCFAEVRQKDKASDSIYVVRYVFLTCVLASS